MATNLSGDYLAAKCYRANGQTFLDLSGKVVEKRIQRRIQDDDVSSIIEFLAFSKSIDYLNLSYNEITGVGFSYLADFLATDSTLISLSLAYNNIQTIEFQTGVLSAKWCLKSLILTGNKLGGDNSILNVIQENESLVQLELGDTDQTMRTTIDILTNFIPQYRRNLNASTIQILDISRILPQSKIFETIYMTHVIRFLEKVLLCHKFKRIKLRQNSITDSDIEILLDSLSRCSHLESLDLSGNSLTSHGLELLSSVLPFTNIEELDISSNRVGDNGASALGLIWCKTKIKYLNISNNRIDDIGMRNLLIGLRQRDTPPERFYVYGNLLTNRSANLLYQTANEGIVALHGMDIIFDWNAEEKLIFFEDTSLKKFTCEYALAHELSKKETKLFQRHGYNMCCINKEEECKGVLEHKKLKKLKKLLSNKLKYFV